MPFYVYWKNKDFVYLGCNDLTAKLLHLPSRQSIEGKTDYDFGWKKEDVDAYRKIDEQIIRTGKSIPNLQETVFIDGKPVYLQVSKEPIFNNRNEIMGIIGISIDITREKKAHEKSEVANQAKAEFLRNMEHQLRTPFSGIYSIIEMLAQTEIDPEKKEMMHVVYSSAKEFLNLLNDIIDFSRNQRAITPIIAKKFDLKQLIEQIVTMQQATAFDKKLSLTMSYPEQIPTFYIGDPTRTKRLLMNLLSNALKFTEQGAINIQVKVAKNIDKKNLILQLIVTDTGIGIAPEHQEMVYEKFYRVSPANHNKYQGAGLGLYIIKQLLEELEGEIELVSKIGKGSRFICTLPFKRPFLDTPILEEY